MSSPQDVAQAFVTHFYQTFDAGVDNLAGLFVSVFAVVQSESNAIAMSTLTLGLNVCLP